jgi:2-dehydro-3-deoxyphosphogluconate aldolase / (4S)-4-hydroxy-2-oxoglutarate aldolase
MDLQRFKATPVIGILRAWADVAIEDLVEAVSASGLKTIEITMNSFDAASLIRRAVKSSNGRLMIGAGTVLTTDLLKEALDAGASFAVMPTLVEDVIGYCTKNIIPVFPGALTPQEVYNAWNAGATMVKVFPASLFGPSYIKELKAPFEKIELLACGGVTPNNIKSYFSNGASAVAFGSSIFRNDWLKDHEFEKIRHAIKELIDNAR